MKRTLTLLTFILVVFQAFSQITLTNAIFPKIGDTLTTSLDVDANGVMLTAPGPGQIWNFSQLEELFKQQVVIKAATEGSAYASFPRANQVIHLETGVERYYRVTNDRVEEVGYLGIDPIFNVIELVAVYPKPYVIQRAPVNYEEMYSMESLLLFPYAYDEIPDSITARFPLQISPDSVRLKVVINREDEVDAWGTLEIPSGTYEVLREVRTEYRETTVEALIIGLTGWFDITSTLKTIIPDTSVLGLDTVVTYTFMSDVSKEPIAVVTPNQQGSFTRVDFKADSRITSVRPVQNTDRVNIHATPNPTLGPCTFSFENLPIGEYSLQIINILGSKIWEKPFEGAGDISFMEDLSGLRKGTYLYSLKSHTGATIMTKRLIVLNP